MLDLRQTLSWLSRARLVGRGDEAVSGISTDPRRIHEGALFIALRGEQFDAHHFVNQARRSGARAVMVERWVPGLKAPVLMVPDTRKAYGEIARGWRRQFRLPLITVAGSNGKTTTKEMIAAILARHVGDRAALSTRGNLNNDVGVPQTLMALRPRHQAAVIELGTNHPGEIAELARYTLADVALVTNAQREHQEFLQGVEGSARENGDSIAALASGGIAVFPGDDACAPIWQAQAGDRRCIRFGWATQEGVFDVWADPQARPDRFELHIGARAATVQLNIAGRHNVRNALAAAASCHAIGVPLDTIVQGLQRFHPATGRLQHHTLGPALSLIDDSYNANPDSVRAAVDVLRDLPAPRTLVLGDMGEVGDQGEDFHREVGAYAASGGLDRFWTLGEATRASHAAFESARGNGQQAIHFDSAEAIIAALGAERGEASGTWLVKGSRFMKMERIVTGLGIERDPAGHGGRH